MLGMLIIALFDLEKLLSTADLTAAMSVEGQLGSDSVFKDELHLPLRPHPGQAASAKNMLNTMADSAIVASHKDSTHLVQDAYSLRCSPQVTGAARDAATFAAQVAARELRAAIDNPVVLPDGSVSSNGNFHGAPLAHQLDFLAIVVADVASIAERRTDRFMDRTRNEGLNSFLADDPGVDSGLMIAHYTQAAMVAETKRLAAPASVDSIPSSAMQEDHVSMGWGAARKLRAAITNLTRVLAVELYAAARAIDLREHAASPVSAAVIKALRTTVPGPGPDRFMSPELAQTVEFVASGQALAAASKVKGFAHTLVDTDGTELTGLADTDNASDAGSQPGAGGQA